MRIDQRMAHAGLRGEMDHARKAMRGEQRGDAVAIGDVARARSEMPESRASSASRACFSAGS